MDSLPNGLLNIKPPLLDIPDQQFRKVVQLLEAVRHRHEVREALDFVRPRIVRLRPPRPLNLQRTCYLPIEDLLIYDQQVTADGLVPRISMARAWDFILPRLDPALSQGLAAKLAKTHPRDFTTLNTIGSQLWFPAHQILQEAIEAAPNERQIRRLLVGDRPEMMLDLMQISRLLASGSGIQALKGMLPPRPIRSLNKTQLESIKDTLRDLDLHHPDQAYALLLAVAIRMDVPGYLLELAPRVLQEFSSDDRQLIISKLATFVLGYMTMRVEQTSRDSSMDIADRALAAGSLVESLTATERSMRAVAPMMKKELKMVRTAAEAAVSEILNEARHEVNAAMKAGPHAPLEDRIRSEKSLMALRRCARFAERIGLDRDVSETLEAVAKDMRHRAQTITELALGNEENEIVIKSRKSELIWALRMLEVGGEIEEAETLWRRATAPPPKISSSS